VAYCDWSAQELGIAAKLSGDEVMMSAYSSGDPYLFLAERFGVVPRGATKKTHREIREQFKILSLGVLYGLSEFGLSRRLNEPLYRGRLLLQMHKETFRRFWEWSEQVEMDAMLTNLQRTVFGWTYHVDHDVNPRSFRNFPMQGNGAEMMRLACCLATERGIKVCAPVHDAILVEGGAHEIDDVVKRTVEVMEEASEIVLDGFRLRVGAEVVRYPDRYVDERGEDMWNTVTRLLEQCKGKRQACTHW
jgi:DNA polymerase I-like protein with 3'-5' exonuclease and polymerase domains